MKALYSGRLWMGAGLLLALGMAVWGLAGLVQVPPGAAALDRTLSGSPQLDMPRSNGLSLGSATAPIGTSTHTVFLPLLSRMSPSNLWQGEYYANPNLTGDPKYTTLEERVDYEWASDESPPGLPSDRFSVRWTGSWGFEVGEYTFSVLADDGVRLWLDDQLLIDAWSPGVGTHQATVGVTTLGLHRLRLEYFENTGKAAIRLLWRRTDLYPYWQGDYYGGPWVEKKDWKYDSIDPVIQFDWGLDCPTGLPCESFSVAWTARRLLEPGTHRILLYADDGYQLYVDGNKVKEGGWHVGQAGGRVDVEHLLQVGALEFHDIAYHMNDQGTLAEARLWIEYDGQPEWKVEYFANPHLTGEPALVRDEQAIFSDWGLDKARPSLPSADNFSIRWSGQRTFHAGCYRFGLFADDGVRLWVDGQLLVDQWRVGRAEHYSPATYLSTGLHEIIVEYFEGVGEAEIRFWWE